MPMISVRVPEELAARFDTAADLVGGRSALLRRLMGSVAASRASSVAQPGPRSAARISVRLTALEAARVELEADRVGLRPATWVAALVRRRVLGQPTFGVTDQQLLIGTRAELRRIGVNLNQIARALNTAVLEGRVLELELASIDDFRRELAAHIGALGEAFAGNLAYWDLEG